MSTDDINFRYYKVGDGPQIVKLLVSVFNGWPNFNLACSSLDHWRWKYLEKPDNTINIAVAEHNGDIIACSHFMLNKIKINKKIIDGSVNVDVATHPDYRGRGIYTKLNEMGNIECKNHNHDFRYDIETNPILIEKFIKKGIHNLYPHNIMRFAYIDNIEKHFKIMNIKDSIIKRIGYKSIQKINSLSLFHKHNKKIDEFNINKIEAFTPEIDEFWSEVNEQYDYILVRNKLHLNWRYFDYRGGKYDVWIAKNNKILGYIVVRINFKIQEYPIGYVVDFLYLKDRLDVADELLETAIKYMKNMKVNVIYGIATLGGIDENLHNRFGLINVGERILLTYNPILNDNIPDLIQNCPNDRLYFTFGDYDHI